MNNLPQPPAGSTERQSVNPARLRFTWGASKREPARWRLGVLCWFRRAKSPSTGNYYVPTINEVKYPLALVVSVRGLLLWIITLGLSALLGGAGVLHALYSKKPFNRVTYADLALPWRWSGLDALRGQSNLAQAAQNLKDGDVRSAFTYLRTGLSRYPADNDARLQLATLFILYRVRAEAENTLVQALDHGYPGKDYIRKAVELLQSGDNQARLIAFCDRALDANSASPSPSKTEARFLDGIKTKTLLEIDRSDEALQLVEKRYPDDIPFLHMTRVMHALARDDIAGAEARLEEWLRIAPDSPEALASGVRVCRRAGKTDRMQSFILKLRSAYPDNPAYVSLGITENLLASQTAAALDLLDISVIRFADRPYAYSDWAEAISQTGRLDALARLEQLVRESGQNPLPVIITRMMTAIRLKNWAEASECDARLRDMDSAMSPRFRSIHQVTSALLQACTQPVKGAQSTLVNSLTGGWVGLHLYRQIIEALDAAGRYEAALEVITIAEGYFPGSRYIAGKRTFLAAKTAEQKALAETKVDRMQAPGEAPRDFADENALNTAVDAEVAAGRPDEALRLIRATRNAAPSWLPGTERKLDWREIQICALAGDLPQLQLKLRESLRVPSAADIDRVINQAESWNAGKRGPAALLAIREVLRAQPAHAKAASLLAAWAPVNETVDNPLAAPALPASAPELFASIDAALAASNKAGAPAESLLRQIRSLKKSEPDWLAAALPELEWREIKLAANADDMPLLQLNLRTYLRGRAGAEERCLTLAREWHEQGKNSLALLVVRELLRQNPDHKAASKLLLDWSAP